MTKYYNAIANKIKNNRADILARYDISEEIKAAKLVTLSAVVSDLSSVFYANNSKFDEGRFRAACGF